MKYNSNQLLDSLQSDVRQLILAAEKLRSHQYVLQENPSFNAWSVAQVLQHLNIYAKHYLPAIEDALHNYQQRQSLFFRPGWLGSYFTNLMKPGQNNSMKKKMKSPKKALPQQQPDGMTELQTFLNDQHLLLNLLQLARTADLSGVRIPTSLSSLLRLKLGDTFRFFIAHEQRHFVQIQNNLQQLLTLKQDVEKEISEGRAA